MGTSSQRNGWEQDRNEVHDTLENFVREGARRMLATALDEGVSTFLGRCRYQRGNAFRRYRNGHHSPAREVTVSLGPVEVRVP